jgi:hypothetical protein
MFQSTRGFSHRRTQLHTFPKFHPKEPMKLKDAIAEIRLCRIVDPARAEMLEAKILGREASVNIDPTDNPERKAARALFGLV